MSKQFEVEVAYARPERQLIIKLMIDEGCTAEMAVRQSGMLQEFPEIDLTQNKLGIFSRAVKPDTVLRAHDRIEIYRPLQADPKEVRRQRATAAKEGRRSDDD